MTNRAEARPLVPTAGTPRWINLIRPEQVHGSLYTDPAIFQAELEKIWYRTWVYVGHESEVPEANDYVMKSIGPEPVIMTRGRDGRVNLLHNRCPHRGNRVCMTEKGNARSFTCPFHAWTFDNDGSLRGFPFPSGYEGVDRSALRLGRVARVASYKGFVFGSFAADGQSLDEHLGPAKGAIDALCLTSPEGEVEITAGFLKHKVKSNWKFLFENETDGYHPAFTHASIFAVAESGIGSLYGGNSTAVARYFGNGHSEIDLRPEFRKRGQPLSSVRHHRRPPSRLCSADDCDLRSGGGQADHDRRHAPHHDLPEPVHRRNSVVRTSTNSRRPDRAARHGAAVQGSAGSEPSHATADHGLGGPGGLSAR